MREFRRFHETPSQIKKIKMPCRPSEVLNNTARKLVVSMCCLLCLGQNEL